MGELENRQSLSCFVIFDQKNEKHWKDKKKTSDFTESPGEQSLVLNISQPAPGEVLQQADVADTIFKLTVGAENAAKLIFD